MVEITIIVRTFNCDWIVDQALTSIEGQKGIKSRLIIVDSGSTDHTLEIINRYQHQFIAITPGTYFPGKVLNQAIKSAKTELIVFINSDVVLLHPYTLYYLIQPLIKDTKCAGSFGRQLVRPEATMSVKNEYQKAFPKDGNPPEWMHYSLPIAAMKKSVWEKFPFYTDAWGSEDTHWGKNIKQLGYDIAYVPDAIAMHSHNYTLKQLSSRRRIEGEADVFIYPDRDYTILSMLKSLVYSFTKDTLMYLKNFRIYKIPYLFIYRIVYVWYYYKGFKHAKKRKNTITYGDYQ